MKRTNPDQPPFLSWCMIVRGRFDHDAELLEGCLKSLRARTPNAELVLIDTMSPHQGFIEVAQRYADHWEQWTGPRGDWTTDMHAFDDAAAARQRSFELAHGVWRGVIDHDEEIVGPETAQRLLKLNAKLDGAVPIGKGTTIIGGANETFGFEDYIKMIVKAAPETAYFTAPCLYRLQLNGDFAKKMNGAKCLPSPAEWPDDVGIASIWENAKTKIVKWGNKPEGDWYWREPGHEVLVPRDLNWKESPVHLNKLLYVHRKLFSAEEDRYSTERHFKILYDNYLKGERSSRNLLYLANFSLSLCPHMEAQFLSDAHRAAVLPMERTRALIELGNYATRSGLYHDAREAYGGAVQFRGDLPDPWLAGAASALYFEDWAWAVDWYMEAMKRQVGPDSMITPRDHTLLTPIMCASALLRVSREQIKRGLHSQAEANLNAATTMVKDACGHPAVGPDFIEMSAHLTCVEQELNAQRAAIGLYNLWHFLINNDETQKAAELIKTAPYLLEDHPLVLEMDEWAQPIRKHLTDITAYRHHYHDELGAVATIEEGYKGNLVRIRATIEWLKKHHPNGDIFELGPFDGMVGVPVLRELPGCTYTAVDASQKPIDRFHEVAKRLVPDGDTRLKTMIGTEATLAKMLGTDDKPIKQFDAVIFMEVIEHVQKPIEALKNVTALCKPGGTLVVSTPWGAYDRGHPANTATGEPRDHRGHVRAITAREMYQWCKEAKIEIIELRRVDGDYGIGDTLVMFGTPRRRQQVAQETT